MGVEGGFGGRKFACKSKNSEIGVGERLIDVGTDKFQLVIAFL